MFNFQERYLELLSRNKNLEVDPAIGFQAEYSMIRIEKYLRNGSTKICVSCGKKIPKIRLAACPETLWCKSCVEKYEERRGKPWTRFKNYGKRL